MDNLGATFVDIIDIVQLGPAPARLCASRLRTKVIIVPTELSPDACVRWRCAAFDVVDDAVKVKRRCVVYIVEKYRGYFILKSHSTGPHAYLPARQREYSLLERFPRIELRGQHHQQTR